MFINWLNIRVLDLGQTIVKSKIALDPKPAIPLRTQAFVNPTSIPRSSPMYVKPQKTTRTTTTTTRTTTFCRPSIASNAISQRLRWHPLPGKSAHLPLTKVLNPNKMFLKHSRCPSDTWGIPAFS